VEWYRVGVEWTALEEVCHLWATMLTTCSTLGSKMAASIARQSCTDPSDFYFSFVQYLIDYCIARLVDF